MSIYEKIFESVLNIPIIEIMEKYDVHLKRSGSNYVGPSPFRENSSNTSFTISPRMNIFKDWTLDVGGNGIKFVSLKENISYAEAGLFIAYNFEIIDKLSFEKLTKNKSNFKDVSLNLEIEHNKRAEQKKKEKADPQVLNDIYSLFKSFCKLSEKHLDHLKNERELDDEEIKEQEFFSFPTRAILRRFLKSIEEKYENQDVLGSIPGFYRRVGDLNFTFMFVKGIGFPIKLDGKNISAFQIRKDVVKEGESRYIWFSSSFAEDDPKNKVELGTGSGAPFDVIIPNKIKNKVIFITEGKFKGLRISKTFNSIACSVQGIANGQKVIPFLKTIQNNKSIINNSKKDFVFDTVYIAYDADFLYNPAVLKQSLKLGRECQKQGFETYFVIWDPKMGKGIDDAIQNNSTFQKIENNVFEIISNKYIEAIINKENIDTSDNNKYGVNKSLLDNLTSLKKDVLKGYYPLFFNYIKDSIA